MENELVQAVLSFRDERGWGVFHNSKDLAISISLEAAELLENFQWSSAEETVARKGPQLADELADVLIYSILMADSLGLELDTIVRNKLEKNKSKYPIEKAFGKKDKYTEL